MGNERAEPELASRLDLLPPKVQAMHLELFFYINKVEPVLAPPWMETPASPP